MDRKNVIIAVLTILLLVSTSASYLFYQQQQYGTDAQGDSRFFSDRNSGTVGNEGALVYSGVSQGTSGATANVVAVRLST